MTLGPRFFKKVGDDGPWQALPAMDNFTWPAQDYVLSGVRNATWAGAETVDGRPTRVLVVTHEGNAQQRNDGWQFQTKLWLDPETNYFLKRETRGSRQEPADPSTGQPLVQRYEADLGVSESQRHDQHRRARGRGGPGGGARQRRRRELGSQTRTYPVETGTRTPGGRCAPLAREASVRVCYFGTYDPTFARNALLIAGLRAAGAEVVECRAPLWHGTADKLAAARGALPGFAWRLAVAWRELVRRHREIGAYDALVVGYAGHLDVLLAHRLARRTGRPVVLDAFLSLAETVEDRGLAGACSPRWQAARLLDRLACRRADRALVDTLAHAAYFAHGLSVPAARLAVVPMGAWPRAPLPPPPADGFEVVYYGGYIPLHGLEHVLGAARRLQSLPDVRFTLVGDGQEYAAMAALAHEWGLTNVRFAREWLSEDTLVARYLAPAHVCLGVFGASPKAARVVPAKALLALAAGRPVVTRDSPGGARATGRRGARAALCPGRCGRARRRAAAPACRWGAARTAGRRGAAAGGGPAGAGAAGPSTAGDLGRGGR